MTPFRFKIFLLILFSLFFSQIAYCENSALETIQNSNDAILELYKKKKTEESDLSEQVYSVMEKVTDFQTIADSALQHFCTTPKNPTCLAIKQELIQLLKLSATAKLGRYRASSFDYTGQMQTEDSTIVKTIAHFGEDLVTLDYVLKKKQNEWKIVNYIVDDIDTVRNYQKQFKRILRKGTLETLLTRLKKQNKR